MKTYYEHGGITIYHLISTPICDKLSLWRCTDVRSRKSKKI